MELTTMVLALVLIGVATSALFVFVSAARLYVSHDVPYAEEVDRRSPGAQHERRTRGPSGRVGDRRKWDGNVEFPLRLGNVVIEHERRHMPDRRQGIVH